MKWSQLLSSRRLGEDSAREYDPARPPWQVDYDRLVFSSAFRRLQDKTQVHPLSASDYVRTRLTHTFEVSSVARTLGTMAGASILKSCGEEAYEVKGQKGVLRDFLTPSDVGMIASAAALAHDIGNPPFGHSGEDAIRYWFSTSDVAARVTKMLTPRQQLDFERWEGNAAGFRILTRLQIYRNDNGMRLTTACLGAFMKYPTGADFIHRDKAEAKADIAGKKPGYFESDLEQWQEIAEDTGLIKTGDGRWCRHPLAYLTEAADDICYRIIDLEDGVRLGRITFEDFLKLMQCFLTAEGMNSLEKCPTESDKVAYLRAKAIHKAIQEVFAVFKDRERDMLEGKPMGDLVSQMDSTSAMDGFRDYTTAKVYKMPIVLQIESAGFEIISGLLDSVVNALFPEVADDGNVSKLRKKNRMLFGEKVRELIPLEFIITEEEIERRAYEQLLLAVDFVAGMTDTFALDLYRKLRGVTIPH
jgi:dGTPase